ncbi:NUDIX domain-containing protein [Parapusillimonas sp. SGNA-6]|uniref:NUDIX domain-containing protein n=1 Tax=Parapedobacter sp. SGR-10 TaxID=2710879 RepID=UPI0013D5510D|nr:NUDIX domain-containing protein [Parapedobacter sp. SGR-10]NGF57145.1 NUDIX domain-containing protein [Parapedobacter sp. SGR-10]NGM89142.1 NUDIX domain-containing protein [Parapusillimonas sp. SGNA-6]
MYLFNVRVYGILVDQYDRVLISDERTQNVAFTKFPGGGLEYGEGLIDALKREFWEECKLEIDIVQHVYTTDFFEKSSFNDSQILSIYYQVKALNSFELQLKEKPFDFDLDIHTEKQEAFRLIDSNLLKQNDLTFKTDQVAWSAFQEIKNIK